MPPLSARSLWRMAAAVTVAGAVLVVAGLVGRDRHPPPYVIPGASASRGRDALAEYGCRTCHTIPGAGAFEPEVGPPLEHWTRRSYIAGELPNTPPNLVRWIADPQSVEPRTAMPDTGASPRVARDIAAYLYSLP